MCNLGEEFVDSGSYDNTIEMYVKALALIPKPIYEWDAATWFFDTLGDIA